MDTKFEVVISGMSGRFPECDDVTTFRKKLYNLDNFITVDDRKWPVGYKHEFGQITIPDGTGKYLEASGYDFRSFKLNKLFARSNDLLNRKILEPSFEAIVDAGYNPYSLDGENIGVFMSCGFSENDVNCSLNDPNYLFVIGGSRTMQANRISFTFNFKGPSYTYFSDPHGSTQALFTACKCISDGTINAAVVGVASCLVDPKFSLQYIALSHLSADGKCRAFDESANGYGRSESTIVFFLQRAEDAKRNYGTVIFSDASYLGSKSTTLIGYDEDTLTTSLKQIYEQHSGLELISELAFLELSACGLKDLEKFETDAIVNIIGKYTKKPLSVGSIKSNIGHTQASAPFASIVKALFALDSGFIAPNANFSSLNDKLKAFKENHLQVVNKIATLEGNLVAVNSIGLAGTLSHILLKQNPKTQDCNEIQNQPLQRVLLISGRTQDGLVKKIEQIGELPFNHSFVALTNEAFGSYIASHVYRGYVLLPKTLKLKFEVKERGDIKRPIWFLFSGMGSQWNGMGQELLEIPVFADAVKKCDLVLKPKGIDIYNVLTSDDPTLFDNILYSFVGIITMQIALLEVLKKIGIKPNGIIGHSVGENGCAYADGCLTLEQAVLASYERGRASLETKTIKGMMAAIGKGYNDIKDSLPEDITVACHNSADSCTLSGPAEKVNNFVSQLKKEGIFARSVNVANIAYHSKHIAAAAPQLLSNLKKVIPNPKPRSSKWISTSVPEAQWDAPLAQHCSAEYLTNNLLNPVLFEEGTTHVPPNAVVIEIAPHGLLQAILNRSLSNTCTNIALTNRNRMRANLDVLFSAIGRIYMAGCEPDVNVLFPPLSYPVPRNTPSISSYCTWDHTGMEFTSLITKRSPDQPLSGISIPIKVNADAEHSYLLFHKVKEDIIIPPSFFMHLAWQLASVKKNSTLGDFPVLFENIKIHKNILISVRKPRYVSIMVQEGGDFEVILENEKKPKKIVVIMSGNLQILDKESSFKIETELKKNNTKFKVIQKAQFYQHLKDMGYELSQCFTPLNELLFNDNNYYGEIAWDENWVTFLDALMKTSMYSETREKTRLLHPRYIRKLIIDCPKFTSIKKGSLVSCHMSSVTNVLQCEGLKMYGIDFSSRSCERDSVKSTKHKLQGYQFVSFANPRMQTVQQFLEFCLESALEISRTTTANKPFKLNIIEDFSEYAEDLKLVVKKNKYLRANVTVVKVEQFQSVKRLPSNTYQLIITRDLKNKNHNKLAISFILAILPSFRINDDIPEDFIMVTKQNFHENTICLFQKKSSPKTNGSQDIGEHPPDLTMLPDNIFEVKRSIEQSDLKLMLSKEVRDSHKRYLYLMDDDNATLLNEKSSFKSPMALDFPTMLQKDGEWGTYKPVPNNVEKLDETIESYLTADIQLQSVNTFFCCLDDDVRKMSIHDTPQNFSYGLEYSGTDSKGTNIMGLALIHSAEPVSEIDPFLLWKVPKGWSLEDAVTVPHIYAQVYYILMITNVGESSSTVLINMGDQVLFAECCISLFLFHNCSVFVTVSNKQQAENILKKFPKLNRNHILLSDKCQYEYQIKYLTEGTGVDIVVNCLPGLKHVMGSLNCLGNFSYYIETVESNLKDTNEMGMNPFLKSVSFKVILNKISIILKLSPDEKQIIQKHMVEGIKCGIVKPLQRVTSINGHAENADSDLKSYKKVIKCVPQCSVDVTSLKLRYDDSHSYIIVVGERKENLWLELTECLIRKGARQFIIVFDNIPSGAKISHQINRLMSQKKTFISMTTSRKINTVEDAADLIADANRIASLEAIYFVSMDSSSQKIRNLNEASQLCNSPAHFVSLFSGGLKELELRRKKGLPAVVIHNECYPKKLSDLLSDIDHCMAHRDPNNAPTLYEVVNETPILEMKDVSSILNNYLPKDRKTWWQIGSDVTTSVMFEERTSLSPRYTEVKGVYPVFVIPCIHYQFMDNVLRKLFYPVFCATLSETPSSIPELATALFQELNKIQPRGPVTVISEAWSAAVAIELGSLIAKSGRKFRIFLIDGNPVEWKEHTKSFCNDGLLSLENVILKKNSIDEDVPNWPDTNETIRKALNALKTRLLAASQYELNDGIMENVTLFVPHFFRDNSCKFSVTSNVFVVNENQDNRSRYDQISKTINNDAVFSWFD